MAAESYNEGGDNGEEDDDEGNGDQDVERDDDGGMSFEGVDPAAFERLSGNFR